MITRPSAAPAGPPEQRALEARALFERLGAAAADGLVALQREQLDALSEVLEERDEIIGALEQLMPDLRAARAALATGRAERPARLQRLIADIEVAARDAHEAATRLEAAVQAERTRVGRELSGTGQADAATAAYAAASGRRGLDLVR